MKQQQWVSFINKFHTDRTKFQMQEFVSGAQTNKLLAILYFKTNTVYYYFVVDMHKGL